MSEDKLIKPEPITIKCDDGKDRKYIISNFPAVEGIEIVTSYPLSMMPKIGDIPTCHAVMQKIMCYVAVDLGNVEIRLTTKDLINNHCPDWETYAKVVWAMMQKNCSFFRDGRSSDFLENLAQVITEKVLEISTRLSAPSSPMEKQPSTN